MATRDREKHLAYMKAWHKANRESQRAYFKANREKHSASMKAWREANAETHKELRKAWRESNLDRCAAIEAKRRSKKLQATPKWMTAADFEAIREWYTIAKELQWLSEEPLHIDHIIPLQGKDVSGLHIAANLQILPASENISKGNKTADLMVKYISADAIGAVKDGN